MNSHFTAGFADELTKEAGLRSGVRRLIGRGKDYVRRRRLAKQLGVKPADVDKVLAIQRSRARRRKVIGGVAAGVGGLAAGGLIGTKLTEQRD